MGCLAARTKFGMAIGTRRVLPRLALATDTRDLRQLNQQFYDELWVRSRLERPSKFNSWRMLEALCREAPNRLEVGPGLRPRLPIESTHFVDISIHSVRALASLGGHAVQGEITALPFSDSRFDLVCAYDVIEHVMDDRKAFAELARVCVPGARLIFSVPLHEALWTEFDAIVGHARRYEPEALVVRLKEIGFAVEQSAGFGMKPSNPWIVKMGMRWLEKDRDRAMLWYNRIFAPLGILMQRPLRFSPGMIDTDSVSGLVLVCVRRSD
jgi:SAM-dependent methyltransferase